MFFKVFPNGVRVVRPGVDPYDFFHNGSPSVAAVVESCERGGGLRSGVIHDVDEEGAFKTAAGANCRVFCIDGSSVSAQHRFVLSVVEVLNHLICKKQ